MALGGVPVFACAGAPANGPMAAQLHLGVGCGRLGLGFWGSAGRPLLIASLAHGAQIIHLAHRRFTTLTLASAPDNSRQAPAQGRGHEGARGAQARRW